MSEASQVNIRPALQARTRRARERLFKAGQTVFARKGYEEAHIADIAREADCSIGSFYRRFVDKEAFFVALYERFVDQACKNINRYFDSPVLENKSTYAVVVEYIQNSARNFERNRGFFMALLQHGFRDPSEWPLILTVDELQARRIGEFLQSRGHGFEASETDIMLAVQMFEHTFIIKSVGQISDFENPDSPIIAGAIKMFTARFEIKPP